MSIKKKKNICDANGCSFWVSHCLLLFFLLKRKSVLKSWYEFLQLVILLHTGSTDGLEHREEANKSQSKKSQLLEETFF